VNSIELSWEPGREPDLKAYQVWRAEDSGPLVKLAEVAGDVTYSDRQVSAGKHYRYAISASDSKGNTSKPGVAIEVVAQ
jgi:fibronectin type 3 domain-containing protein